MKTEKSAAFTGLFAAIATSSCCIPSLIALIEGVGGSASALSWMEPFRPYMIVFAILAIGYSWYNYLKSKKDNDCGCDIEKPKWFQTKGFLIAITLFAILSISFPYYAYIFYPDNKKEVVVVNLSDIETVNFNVKGMTCTACEIHIEGEVNKLEGIVTVKASYDKGNTYIEYDKTKVTNKNLKNAILKTGYKIQK